jgi:hypothetical protein
MKKILIISFFAMSSSSFAQTVLTIEGQTYTNSAGTWYGVEIPHTTPTTLTFRNNSITSVNTSGYMYMGGDESTGSINNNLDGAVITGNKLTWDGTPGTPITHGLFVGYNINDVIEYNYLDKVPYGVVYKSGTDAGVNMTCTSGGFAYNIVKNSKISVRIKGINGVSIYNNTFYDNLSADNTFIYISSNGDRSIPAASTGTKIKNNIFYATHNGNMIYVDSPADLSGFECDYNIYYTTTGVMNFYDGTGWKNFTQWQALGYDTHSVVVDPDFINFTDFVPSARLDYGTDLGTTWQTGLSVNAVWGTTDPVTTNQNGTWQVGVCLYAGKVYYLSPAGNDATGNGSEGSPWFTLNKAWTIVSAGDVVYMRGGTYNYGSIFTTLSGKSGTSGNYINIWAYPGEYPIIDYTGVTFVKHQNIGIAITDCDYIYLKGIRVTNIPQPNEYDAWPQYGIILWDNVSNCTFEQIETDHIGGWGVTIGDGCNNNLFLNCDSHHNQDPYSIEPYGGADGFQSYSITSTNNTFRGCRSWWNSDDGWDLRGVDGLYTLENCWSFWNGYIPGTLTPGGDGEGMKLTGSRLSSTTEVRRVVKNCLVFENKFTGINQANATYYVGHEVYNTVSYKNGSAGFAYNYIGPSLLRNNISYQNGNNTDNFRVGAGCVHNHNSFDLGITVTNADFLSVNSTGVDGARLADGSLPDINFLHLALGSNLIDAGIDVGLPYNGSAPDLGAFEFTGINNHYPSIIDQTFQIDENSQDGTVAGTIVASDPDADQILDYSIVSGNTDGAFAINDSTGVLSVANSAAVIADFALVVQVQDNGADYLSSQATITIYVIPTGIESTGNNLTIKVYPNPVSDKVIIEIEGNNRSLGFEILNSIGQIVFKGTLSERTVVPTTSFSPGVYLIKIDNGKSLEFKKIMKL